MNIWVGLDIYFFVPSKISHCVLTEKVRKH